MQLIKSFGKRAGVSIVPTTPAKALDYILEDIDLVLIMTVNPGFGGQSFIESQLRKIEKVAEKIAKLGKNIELEVDGGINPQTAKRAIAAGANVLVAGNAVFKTPDYKANIASLRS
ncbi:MAG: hypothetical protein ABL857_04220 [Rickettsiales bacterium]